MQRLISRFPAGNPGLGLLVLRGTLGIHLVAQGLSALDITGRPSAAIAIFDIFLVILGALSSIGVIFPVVQIASVATQLAALNEHSWVGAFSTRAALPWSPIPALAIAVSLALLGPGAYSLDAHLFGRREISIPRSARKPVE